MSTAPTLNAHDDIVIELSKTKVTLLVVGSALFVALSVWMLARGGSVVAMTAAIAGLLFFGLCGAVGIKKLFETKAGLIINRRGIHDSSSGVAAGFIPWSDIEGFSMFVIHNQKMVVVKVVDPEKYIAIGGSLRQTLNRANFKLCGSPLAISANTLKIKFDDLLRVLNESHVRYR
jgi:hypothetical protein